MPSLRLRPDLEVSLRQLPGIRAASVVTGPDAVPTEIHVLASTEKAPKQIVRDVQSVALARFDLDIDHRIVSVVQFEDEGFAEDGAPGQPNGHDRGTDSASSARTRPSVSAVTVRSAGTDLEAVVDLTLGEISWTGQSRGAASAASRPRLVANATLEALTDLLGLTAELEYAGIHPAGERQVVVAVVSVVEPRLGPQPVSGSAIVRGDVADASARAVLDALNRRLTE